MTASDGLRWFEAEGRDATLIISDESFGIAWSRRRSTRPPIVWKDDSTALINEANSPLASVAARISLAMQPASAWSSALVGVTCRANRCPGASTVRRSFDPSCAWPHDRRLLRRLPGSIVAASDRVHYEVVVCGRESVADTQQAIAHNADREACRLLLSETTWSGRSTIICRRRLTFGSQASTASNSQSTSPADEIGKRGAAFLLGVFRTNPPSRQTCFTLHSSQTNQIDARRDGVRGERQPRNAAYFTAPMVRPRTRWR